MKLETSQELLERIRAKYDLSWYGLIDLMQVHKNTVYSWKANHTTVDKRYVLRIAELLDDSPHYVLACLEAERDPDHAKLWKEIAAKFRSNAASILLVALGLMTVPRESAASVFDVELVANCQTNSLYIMRTWRRRWTKVRAWLKSRGAVPLLTRWATERSTAIRPSAWPRSPAPI
jgi:plasmid maintenance system antidote protein VapI